LYRALLGENALLPDRVDEEGELAGEDISRQESGLEVFSRYIIVWPESTIPITG